MTKAEHSIQNVVRRNRDCSEQESDAQSSCTRSEPEAESKHTNSFLEFKQITERQSSTDPKNTLENRDPENPSDNKRKKASTDIEVVHIIDDEPKPSTPMEVDIVRTNPQGNGDKWFSIPAHQLELSLRRSDYGRSEDQEKNDTRTLNHSTSSAFSLYNCRPISSFGNAGDAQPCSTSATHADLQNKNGDSAAPFQDKADPICHPIRVVALPVPVGGLTFDGQPFWSGAPVAPLLYPQSGPPIWNGRTPVSQEVDTQATSSQQSDPTEMDCQQTESTQRQEVLPSPTANEKHLHVEIPSDSNPQQVSPMASESGTGSSTVLNNSGNALSGSACGSSSNRIATPTEQCNASDGATENPSMEGSHQLSQREIALNKFRLKRKERCFEKKVGTRTNLTFPFRSNFFVASHLLGGAGVYILPLLRRCGTRAGNYLQSSVPG
ncbi:hypothetical protein VPH35_099019 [Triticum aestivum]